MLGFGKKGKDDLGLDKDMDFGKDDLGLGFDDPLANPSPTGNQPMGLPQQHISPPQEIPELGMDKPNSFSDFNQNNQMQGFQEIREIKPQNQQVNGQNDLQKDMQLINAKLDAIKSELDAMKQRIMKIESIAVGEYQEHSKKKLW